VKQSYKTMERTPDGTSSFAGSGFIA